MSIKFMILGCLMSKPLHGYAIRKQFMKRAQGINEGQMYTLLKGMEKEGLLLANRETGTQGNPSRKIYRLAPEGRDLFLHWLTSGAEAGCAVTFDFLQHDPFLKKLTFFQHLQLSQAENLIKAELSRSEEKIAEYSRVKEKMIDKEVPFFSLEIIKFAIEQEHFRRKWLEELSGRLNQVFKSG